MAVAPAADVEAIERATLAAVPPQTLEEEGGWLLAFDDGTVGRAHSAVPLRHEAPAPGTLARIERRYRARGHEPGLRLPRLPCFDPLRQELAQAGWCGSQPTLTQTGTTKALARIAPAPGPGEVVLDTRPDDRWAAVFLGTAFDPVDGASRLAILRRSRETVFAQRLVGGVVVAVGAACLAHGWVGLHAMRTAPGQRRNGFARDVLAAFGHEGRRRGVVRAFLQVEEVNTGARALYERACFSAAWAYEYWRAS